MISTTTQTTERDELMAYARTIRARIRASVGGNGGEAFETYVAANSTPDDHPLMIYARTLRARLRASVAPAAPALVG